MQCGRWAFTPDPIEKTAQIGGMVASNASGARTFRYGAMREHVRGLSVVLPSGEVIDLKWGECIVADRPDLCNSQRQACLRVVFEFLFRSD